MKKSTISFIGSLLHTIMIIGAGACALALPVRAGLIFEADFNGIGTGTGGVNDIVALGGTGALNTAVNGVAGSSATISSANSMGQGSYFSSVLVVNSGQWNGKTLTFTPTSSASSWSALSSTTASGTRVALNGGFDAFVRTSLGGAAASNLIRLVNAADFNTGGLRIDLNNGNGGGWALTVYSPTNAIGSNNTTFTASNSYLGTSTTVAADTLTHVAFTFSTDATGKITMNLYVRSDGEAIDTASSTNLIGSRTFYVDSSVSSGVSLLDTGFSTYIWNGSGAISSETDIDLYRIYDSVPTTFSAIPEPSTWMMMGCGMILLFALGVINWKSKIAHVY